ncbi:tol-pal system-associated acyl-CoA thioesterase [Ectothiorhodospiraceae bacterium BW-2]|nr:tol-pal system-associated acyl-CoA thioesterase [Ectothiorhodospiraceae bacterium BW-2]
MSYQFNWPVRVYYEDTDNGGVVYYANYLKFMERCRTEWLRSIGYEQDLLLVEENIIFAVRRVELDYRAPARFNDLLQVSASMVKLGRASIDFYQSVRRGEELLCEGQIALASLRADTLRPQSLPKRLHNAMSDQKLLVHHEFER